MNRSIPKSSVQGGRGRKGGALIVQVMVGGGRGSRNLYVKMLPKRSLLDLRLENGR